MATGPSLRDIDVRHLAALSAVAAERSFGKAAERLGFTQSAVSQQIAALERIVGEPLFDRPGGPKPVSLTPAGRLLLEHAEAILGRLDAAAQELDRLRAGAGGRLVIGTFQSVSVKVLPAVVGRLREESPELDIRVFERDENEALLERLEAEELDLSFVVGPIEDDRFEMFDLCEDPFVVLSPPALAAESGALPTPELTDAPLIGQHNSSCQLRIDNGLRGFGVDPQYVFRSNDNGAVQAMVRAGMGRAVMPFLAVDPTDPGVVVQALDPPIPARVITLAVRAGRTRSRAADRLIEIAREVCADLHTSLPEAFAHARA